MPVVKGAWSSLLLDDAIRKWRREMPRFTFNEKTGTEVPINDPHLTLIKEFEAAVVANTKSKGKSKKNREILTAARGQLVYEIYALQKDRDDLLRDKEKEKQARVFALANPFDPGKIFSVQENQVAGHRWESDTKLAHPSAARNLEWALFADLRDGRVTALELQKEIESGKLTQPTRIAIINALRSYALNSVPK